MADAPPNAIVLLRVGVDYFNSIERKADSWLDYRGSCNKSAEYMVCFKSTSISAAYIADQSILTAALPDGWSLKSNAITATNYQNVGLSILHIVSTAQRGLYSMQFDIAGFGSYRLQLDVK